MRLLRVRLEHVKGVATNEVRFAEQGVTVVHAPNESGKSTLLDAVDVALAYKDSSTAQPVKDLQPAGQDVGSTIEVELRFGEVHLTYRKTFNRDRATVLQIHAPQPEQLTGNEAHDRLRQLMDADVDGALYEALRFRQGRPFVPVELGGSDVLADRLDATAGGPGTDDGGVMDRVEQEYLRWYTPSGREGQQLRQLDEAVARASSTYEELQRAAAALDEDTQALGDIDRRLPQLERHRTDVLVPAVEAATTARDHLAKLQALLHERARDADAEAKAYRMARQDLQQREDLLGDERRLVERCEEHARLITAHEDKLQALRADQDAAAVAADRAKTAASDARRLLDRSEARLALALACDEHRQLHDRVTTAKRAIDDGAAAADELRRCRVDDTGVRRLRKAVERREIARGTLEASAPHLLVRAHGDAALMLDGNPRALRAGDELDDVVATERTLVIGDVEVTVRPGGSATELRDALTDEDRAVQRACEQLGVRDLEDAERRLARRRELEAVVSRRDEVLARELAGRRLPELEAELARSWRDVEVATDRLRQLDGQGADGTPATPDGEDAAPATADLGALRAEVGDNRTRYDQAREAFDTATRAVQRIDAALEGTQKELAARREREADDRNDLAQVRARLDELRKDRDDEAVRTTVEQAEQRVATAAKERDRTAAELSKTDAAAVERAVTAAQERLRRVDDERRTLETRQVELRTRLQLQGENGLGERLSEAAAVLEVAETARDRDRRRAAAVRLLRDELHAARDEAYRTYRGPLAERIDHHVAQLLGKPVTVTLDDRLQLTHRTVDGVTLAWDQLSAGAREQLAILTALAAAELAGNDGVPLVLDDTLGATDPQRLQRLGRVLSESVDAQVIVLTCVADRFAGLRGARMVHLAGGTTPSEDTAASQHTAASQDTAVGVSDTRPKHIATRKRPPATRTRRAAATRDSGAEPLQLDLGT